MSERSDSKGHCRECGQDSGYRHRFGCPVLGDPVELAATAYLKHYLGDPMTDAEVEAGAKVALRLARELQPFGADFNLARKALLGFGVDMEKYAEHRRQSGSPQPDNGPDEWGPHGGRLTVDPQSGSTEASPAEASTASNPHNPHRGAGMSNADDGGDRGESYWGVACTCDAPSPLATWHRSNCAITYLGYRITAPSTQSGREAQE